MIGKLMSLMSCVVLCSLCCVSNTMGTELILSDGGKSEYVIVVPDNINDVDTFAVNELASSLKEATGVDFKSVSAADAPKYNRRIFIGAQPVNTKHNLNAMADQESICESDGPDIFLYGKGIHGNLYAVYDFLESSIGCRWFSAYAKPSIPRRDSLRIESINKKTKPDFKYRDMWSDPFLLRPEASLFLSRNRLNMGQEKATGKGSGMWMKCNIFSL